MGLKLNSMRTMKRSALVVRLGLIGAFAGLAAWVLVLAGHVIFGIDRPSVVMLLLAIPRGALFGAILALFLHAWWSYSDRGKR